VGQIKLGMHILRADECIGVITGYTLVPGVETMYNLRLLTITPSRWVMGSGSCIMSAALLIVKVYLILSL
jgi:hypothetical protein